MSVSFTKTFTIVTIFCSFIFKLKDVNTVSVKHQFYLEHERLLSPYGKYPLKL